MEFSLIRISECCIWAAENPTSPNFLALNFLADMTNVPIICPSQFGTFKVAVSNSNLRQSIYHAIMNHIWKSRFQCGKIYIVNFRLGMSFSDLKNLCPLFRVLTVAMSNQKLCQVNFYTDINNLWKFRSQFRSKSIWIAFCILHSKHIAKINFVHIQYTK